MNTKKFTILHSNDIHGDYQAEINGEEGELIGGVSIISGYLNKVRSQEKNVLYLVAGDMVQGGMIDSEFKGVSGLEIMNYLSPDVTTIGNHEVDYGLPHLLFLEKIANFPIINANLYLKPYAKRVLPSHHILNKDGFTILVIGLVAEVTLAFLKSDTQIFEYVYMEDMKQEVGKICDTYKTDDIDLTILLTHIGFDEDKKLAESLDPAWGVDMIIGGHSHTILEQPAKVNNILIAQAGVGTNQLGRFDITVDDDTNSIVESKWQLLQVDSNLAEPDDGMQAFLDQFQEVVDRKYGRLLCRFARQLTNPSRTEETEVGNLLADIFAEQAQVDIALAYSRVIRQPLFGPAVTLQNLMELYPSDLPFVKRSVTGALLKKIFETISNPASRGFQVSKGVKAVYNTGANKLESLTLNGESIEDDKVYTFGVQGGVEGYLPATSEELDALGGAKTVMTSTLNVLDEYLTNHQNMVKEVEGRFATV